MSAEPQKMLCPCGSTISLKNKTQHEKSQKHILAMTQATIKEMPSVGAVITTLSEAKVATPPSDFEGEVLTSLNHLISAIEVLRSGLEQLMEAVEGLYDEDDIEEEDEDSKAFDERVKRQ